MPPGQQIFIRRFLPLSPAQNSWWRWKLPSCVLLIWLTILFNLGVLMRVINKTGTRKVSRWVMWSPWYFLLIFCYYKNNYKHKIRGQFWVSFRKLMSIDGNKNSHNLQKLVENIWNHQTQRLQFPKKQKWPFFFFLFFSFDLQFCMTMPLRGW